MPSGTMLGIELEAQADGARPKHQTSVAAGLLDCRKQYAELEIARERELHTHNDRLYNLAPVIFRLATALSDQAAWREFVASPDWQERKRPRQSDHANAFRHAVRYVLPPGVSRQILSHWTRPLEVLRTKGFQRPRSRGKSRAGAGFRRCARQGHEPKDEGRPTTILPSYSRERHPPFRKFYAMRSLSRASTERTASKMVSTGCWLS